LIAATLLGACGGSVTIADDAGRRPGIDDASEADSGADALMCPPGSAVPDANVYQCEAGPPGSAGCQALSGDPGAVYPAGCALERSIQGGFCEGPCCGPLSCTCQPVPGPGGAMSLQFVCPD
jgi:hypothetical protein